MINIGNDSIPPFSPPWDEQVRFDRDIPAAVSASQQSVAHDTPSTTSHVDDQTKVILPYAIEEPDDEPTDGWENSSERPRSALLLVGGLDNEQGDLADSIEGLYCDSDPTSRRSSFAAKRGMKRKPSSAPIASNRPIRPLSTNNATVTSETVPSGRAKRQRRRSQHSRNQLGLFTDVFWHGDGSETGSSGDCDSRSPSTDFSSPRPHEPTPTDQMDID
ncbi:uncharacterized protein BO97DRAFT_112991 [Aspergillus homomorphus CBS 101889]|uniref:Uncharacterized protein n=1 Tax=Aspergillus homomorphus (strain CBS 101889) TaxID=1450537 RepID=A0A395HTT8_ASPHC|nr:hypothetical protein BO97DRAFT_112991 [Aspergillus homomorphus CBS 101889]RAL10795.1 hypothetical protein BO97DRAFT_112991 [Aspergillus homomorphus CBS 101889]